MGRLSREWPEAVVNRHPLLIYALFLSGVLALFRYWAIRLGLKQRQNFAAGFLGFALVLKLISPFPMRPFGEPSEQASQWALYQPLLERGSFCIPALGFPSHTMTKNCEHLLTSKIDDFGGRPQLRELPHFNPQWKLNGVMVQWTNSKFDRRALRLVSKDRSAKQIEFRPITEAKSRFQYFDLGDIKHKEDLVSLSLSPILGAPQGTILVHFLGSRI